MPDYSLAKIYQIICNTTGKRYIGSTVQKKLCTRLATHVSKKNTTTSREIIEGGNYDMVLIENFPCDSKDELHKRERHFIETLDNCVNKYIPNRTKKEYRHDNRKKIKDYYVENKIEILKKHKNYYDNNREQILKQQKAYDKEYRLKNRDIINQKQKDKYQAKKLTQEEHRSERREYWQSKKEIQNDSLNHPE